MKNISIKLTNAAEDQYLENVSLSILDKCIIILESLKASLNLRWDDLQNKKEE